MAVNAVSELAAQWGARVRAKREEAGLTQTQLAAMILTAGGNISRIERGEYVLGDEVRMKIARALNVRVEELFAYPDTTAGVTEVIS